MSFSELKQKDVINVMDGKRLGKPIDVLFTEGACIEAIVVPDAFNIMTCLSKNKNGIEIPWERVRRIGDDVILVDINMESCK
ncbi:MAG: YlmC/YmxH family sporulation protein [Clostridia bacterium]|nr:YlmC/YmxH family sporulation protein [Clostridia bacterium]MBQ4158386.1 YlmC/YmxH family sporulation protein [Clostridia bacterium]MBQ9856941.1 YlmC/YmxH family sporulation protein [Clostridia bacterium]